MNSSVVQETYKKYFTFGDIGDVLLFALFIITILLTITVIVGLVGEIKEKKRGKVTRNTELIVYTLSLTIFFILAIWTGLGIFAPAHVTKTTQVLRKSRPVVQVEGKLLSQNGLTLYLRNDDGNFDRKFIFADGFSRIKEEGTSYKYEIVTTKVEYRVQNTLLVPELKSTPRNRTEEKVIVTVPKGSLIHKN